MTHFVVYDVFTDTPFGGNQLAVLPDGEGVKPDLLQTVAAEFNFSETVFVFPPDDLRHTARLRIFTPQRELPFAGHPIIGAAVALSRLGFPTDMTLETGVGPILCEVTGDRAGFVVDRPLERHAEPPVASVAAALGLAEDSIDTRVHPPVQAGVGASFTLVRLADRDALARCRPDVAAMRDLADRHPDAMGYLAYAPDNDAGLHARMFAPLEGIPQDPATGSAASPLAALLSQIEGPQDLTIHQGVEMGRPSVIRAQADAGQVRISGAAVQTMEGHLVAR